MRNQVLLMRESLITVPCQPVLGKCETRNWIKWMTYLNNDSSEWCITQVVNHMSSTIDKTYTFESVKIRSKIIFLDLSTRERLGQSKLLTPYDVFTKRRESSNHALVFQFKWRSHGCLSKLEYRPFKSTENWTFWNRYNLYDWSV